MWRCENNQEVGLEAAILERKRNSSLVESACADDIAGLKRLTEAAEILLLLAVTPGGGGGIW